MWLKGLLYGKLPRQGPGRHAQRDLNLDKRVDRTGQPYSNLYLAARQSAGHVDVRDVQGSGSGQS